MNYKLRQFIDGWTVADTILLMIVLAAVFICIEIWIGYNQTLQGPIEPRGPYVEQFTGWQNSTSTLIYSPITDTSTPDTFKPNPSYDKTKQCLKLGNQLVCQ